MKAEAVLILSGYNIRAVIAWCRWATKHQVAYHIVAKNSEDPIFFTDYKAYVAFIRESQQLTHHDFKRWVNELCKQYGYDKILVLPSTEYFNRFLLENRALIEDKNCIIPLVEENLYIQISDKYSFSQLCQAHQLNVPEKFEKTPNQLPFVAKPYNYLSAQGTQLVPQLITTPQALERFQQTEVCENYFFQQFITGRSHYLLAYIAKNGEGVTFSQENLIQQTKGGSIVLARHSDFHQTSVAQQYIKMLQNIKFWGIIMIEVRQTEDNQYFMIEANPRLWGPLQFIVDNQINILGKMLDDFGFKPVQPHKPMRIKSDYYFWSGGIAETSMPLAYHNYSTEQFIRELPYLRVCDIFLRQDTIDLFLIEANMRDIYGK